ncbi:hypothetical protein BOX15_Mlig018686g1 [Macrostomum lignano]|uniref:Uncharacterized protein n=1 Tax=Macrostomum lignano TaxID=282301 RepID=A0A267EC04_9PLAT|nr:hypothetical protein BOX15_Mlig018686g1 [Macrostomum lignano]
MSQFLTNIMSSNKKQQEQLETQSAFRLDFCSPVYLNSLLRQQHLHWLEIHQRSRDSCSIATVITQFLFVIPTSLANLICVLGTEAPLLKAQLGCQLRRVRTPDYVAPDGLQTFSVDYADGGASAHAKFLAALNRICVRLQLTNICLGPADSRSCGDTTVNGARCSACAKVRTHTKTVRGASAAPRFQRQPLLTPPPPSQSQRPKTADKSKEKAAADQMAEAAANEIMHRLQLVNSAIGTAAVATASTRVALRRCEDELMEAAFVKLRLHASAVSIFSDWAGQLTDRLIVGCAGLLARAVALRHAAASGVADAAVDELIRRVATGPLIAELATVERTPLFRACLLCDLRTSRQLLLDQQPLRRRCPDSALPTSSPSSRSDAAWPVTHRCFSWPKVPALPRTQAWAAYCCKRLPHCLSQILRVWHFSNHNIHLAC